MKKFLLLTFCALCATVSLSAKSLTYYYEGSPVTPNGTVNFAGYESYDWGTQVEAFIEPKVYIVADSSDPVTIRTTSNYDIQFCLGGTCEAAKVITKENQVFEPGKQNDLLIDCSVFFDKGTTIELPEIIVKVEAWYNSSPSEITTMTLNMGSAAGATDIVSDSQGIKVRNNALVYNVEKNTTVSVYDLGGHCVRTDVVSGKGVIDLGALHAGLYFYRASGDTSAKGKIIVR